MFSSNLIFYHGSIQLYENITKPQWAKKVAVLTQSHLVIFNSLFTEERENGKIKMLGVLSSISRKEQLWQVDLIKNRVKNSFRVQSKEEAEKWQKMIVLSACWSNYENFCEFQKLPPWIYLLRSAARGDSSLTINLRSFNSFAISEFLRDNTYITSLVLEELGNDIGVLSRVLLCFNTNQLQALTIHRSGLENTSLESAKKLLGCNNFLKSLDLSHNFLTQHSIPVLFKIFIGTPLLENLTLSGNKIGDEGFAMLYPNVLSEIPLMNLWVSDCSISDLSVASINRTFKIRNITLMQLDARKNLFTAEGIKLVLKRFNKYHSKSSFKLKLSPLPIDKDIIKYISPESCVIKRGKNNKPAAKVMRHKEAIDNISKKIDSITESPFVEDLVDLINELSRLDFQFPKIRVENIEKLAYEYLTAAISQPNYYCLELLVPALMKIGIVNDQATELLRVLKPEVDHIVNTLINVLSPELYTEENIPEINSLLDSVVRRCDELCIRGQLVQAAKMLKNKRDELFKKNKQ